MPSQAVDFIERWPDCDVLYDRTEVSVDPQRRALFEQLESPTRHIPFAVAIRLLFGGGLALFGWIWLLVVVVMAVAMGGDQLFQRTLPMTFLETAETTGHLYGDKDANIEVNDRAMVECLFEFEVGGKTYKSFSYTTEFDPILRKQSRTAVKVIYVKLNPSLAVIKGQGAAKAPLFALFILGGFGLVGGILAMLAFVRGVKRLKLLRRGLITSAVFSKRESTNMKVNEETVYKYTFMFDVDGKTYYLETKTHDDEDIMDEAEEPALYLPGQPANAVLIDDIAGELEVANGRWSSAVTGVFWGIVPGVCFLGGVALIWRSLPI